MHLPIPRISAAARSLNVFRVFCPVNLLIVLFRLTLQRLWYRCYLHIESKKRKHEIFAQLKFSSLVINNYADWLAKFSDKKSCRQALTYAEVAQFPELKVLSVFQRHLNLAIEMVSSFHPAGFLTGIVVCSEFRDIVLEVLCAVRLQLQICTETR